MAMGNFVGIHSFLLENKNVKQTIVKNTFWLGFAGVIEKGAALILLIWAARVLGATEYGKFTFALAFVSLFGVVFSFGLRSIVTREFAKDREREKEFPSILSLEIVLGLAGMLLIFASSFFVTDNPAIQAAMWILAVYVLAKSFAGIIFAFFHARERMEYQAFVRMFEAILLLGTGLFVIFTFPSTLNLAIGYTVSMLMVFVGAAALLHFKVQRVSLAWDVAVWKKFFALSWPLALVAGSTALYNDIGSVMMGYFGQLTETGWYNAAYRIVYGSIIPIGFISTSFYPVLSRTVKESKEKLQRAWNAQMNIMIFLAFPITVGGITLAPGIIHMMYGSDFGPAILALQLLMISVYFMFLYDSFRQVLMVYNQQKKILWITIGGAVGNIALNLLLIPQFSLYGAAAATAITHGFLLFFFVFSAVKYTDMNIFHSKLGMSVLAAIGCTALMYGVISLPFLYGLPVVFVVLTGMIAYGICLFGYTRVTKNLWISPFSN